MPKRRGFDHQHHRRTHAGHRAFQRYDAKVTQKDFEEMIGQIISGKAVLVEDQILKKVYDLTHKETEFRVVYHVVKRRIVTFLPKPGTPGHVDYSTPRPQPARVLPFTDIPLDTDFSPKK